MLQDGGGVTEFMAMSIKRLQQWAQAINREVITLWYCRKHPDMPLVAKVMAVLVVAYALSPIDLIPDFIPIIGYLDDLILVPAGIALTLKLIPQQVLQDSRAQAEKWLESKAEKPVNWYAGLFIRMIWCLSGFLVWFYWGK